MGLVGVLVVGERAFLWLLLLLPPLALLLVVGSEGEITAASGEVARPVREVERVR